MITPREEKSFKKTLFCNRHIRQLSSHSTRTCFDYVLISDVIKPQVLFRIGIFNDIYNMITFSLNLTQPKYIFPTLKRFLLVAIGLSQTLLYSLQISPLFYQLSIKSAANSLFRDVHWLRYYISQFSEWRKGSVNRNNTTCHI